MDVGKRIEAIKRARGVGCRICCEGCREELLPGNLEDVQYVKTKRGTELFFHTECADLIWKRKII